MEKRILSLKMIEEFKVHLMDEERSTATIEKYMRDIRRFAEFIGDNELTKELVVVYKKNLIEKMYAACSINSMLSAINSLFVFLMWQDLCVKNIRLQKQIYCAKEKELKKAEYISLLSAAENNPRLRTILQTICGTGIRISELSHFTVEAVRRGEVFVSCKNKTRIILVPRKLRNLLMKYCKREGIRSGTIFRTRSGKPVDRSNIWREMKALCEKAGVNPSKVFPHNLRKLFARTFYRMEKDVAKLADILGHSSIDTTRIYIMTTKIEHRRKIERLGLVVW